MLRMAIAMMAIGVMAGGDAWAGTRPQPPIDCRHIGGAARHRDCERANAGDAERQSYVGFLLASGRGAARNDDDAARLLSLAAEAGDATALVNLGVMHMTRGFVFEQDAEAGCGRAIDRDKAECRFDFAAREAVSLFKLAADRGSVRAQAYLGIMHVKLWGIDHGGTPTGVALLRAAAAQGDSFAQLSLGHLHEIALGVARDYAEAGRWFRRAAEQGDERGMSGLALRLAAGPETRTEALAWAKKAALIAPDDAEIQFVLARVMYLEHDPKGALPHARAAAMRADCAEFSLQLGDILAQLGNRAEAGRYQRHAFELYETAPVAGGLGQGSLECSGVKFKLIEPSVK